MARRAEGDQVSTIDGEILAHADSLYNLARYLTGRSADAEDLVQETFIRALKAAPRLGLDRNLKPWLFRILRNTFHDNYRREKKHRAESFEEEIFTAAGAPSGRDAELDMLREATVREIQSAMAKLGEEGRTVLLLDLEGFTETEIAEIMVCPVGTVKSRLMRARMSLRKRLVGEAE